ncbi:DUF6492 family protein [Paenibacillus mucilaginosus]|uniref:Nucleotide-diphospho-sugar transferase domain-containing protein n=1 Tax=Paenibacillus mucilaginosus (strain KNP414) TaxID=1036673 RepID=F8FBV2_PAEMK|nr:DUF6492 family protein [Paenibacillus mucilaginosus]AEI43713.1 hypothetical protein KNP414_05189 [Paenibacillus mucilaginosus KNP414]MCG7212760.1 DUF6492 family protein [Paenibacillus mucilaginosus]WDM25226.1 hypothetical protein KCX80_22500 [Paenibacillus mucilaginosus]
MSNRAARRPGGGPAIDVLIPAIEKDLHTLPYVIDSIRAFVRHPIGRIYVVSPDSRRIRALCAKKKCTFVLETRLLPLTKSRIRYRSRTWDRSGWLYQQLLKLSGDRVCRRSFLVVDADTVFIRPHRFRIGGRPVFYCRNWSQPEYFRTYRKLMGRRKTAPRSFVTHYMLFERSKLRSLKKTMEKRHGRPWYKAILKSIDRRKQFGFSEFETYGNYVYAHRSKSCILRSARNKALSSHPSRLKGSLVRRLSKAYRTVSFHQRSVYKRGVKARRR